MSRLLLAASVLTCLPPLAWGDEKPPPAVRALAFSPDGKRLAVAVVEGGKGELSVREVKSKRAKWRQPYDGPVRAVRFLPAGKTLIVAAGPSLLLVDAESGKTSRTLGEHDDAVVALGLSLDGKVLASGDEKGSIRIWDVSKEEMKTSFRHPGAVYNLALSPDGRRLMSASGREARLWDVRKGKSLATLAHDYFHVSCVAVLPGGEVMTGGYDGTARLWDAENSYQKMLLQGVGGLRGLFFEPKTQALVMWSDYSVHLTRFDRRPDAATRKKIDALIEKLDEDDYEKREAAEAELLKFGFLAEPALRQAKGAKSAEVRVRARRAWQTLLTKPTVTIDVKARVVALSANGKTLALGGEGGAVLLYDAATGKALGKGKE